MKTSIRALHGIGNKTLPVVAAASLALLLQGCIDSKNDALGGGGPVDPGNPDPTVCSHLPVAQTSYKGGNTWGEELTVSLDPSTMAYAITIDASLQRTAGTVHSGTLTPLTQECTYSSNESGAVFTLARGGVLQGGIDAPSGSGFAPLLAFRNTFVPPTEEPRRFNDVAISRAIVIGVAQDGAGTKPWMSAGILRNAGTIQTCIVDTSYSANCTPRERGYLTAHIAERNAFDYYATDPAVSTPITGGDLAGSAVIGLVNGEGVILQLMRTTSSYGLRLILPEVRTASAEGRFTTLDVASNVDVVTTTATGLTRGSQTATVTADTPSLGFSAASGDITGNFALHAGIYAFVSTATGQPTLELGVSN
jgi:hypothetical protein